MRAQSSINENDQRANKPNNRSVASINVYPYVHFTARTRIICVLAGPVIRNDDKYYEAGNDRLRWGTAYGLDNITYIMIAENLIFFRRIKVEISKAVWRHHNVIINGHGDRNSIQTRRIISVYDLDVYFD